MTDLYDEARSRRNALERLGEKIPGYRGFQDRELRREVDRVHREHLAQRIARVKKTVRGLAAASTDAGRLEALTLLDRLDRRLDGLSQAVRFADYGASGLFDALKVREEELERLYAFDLSLEEDVERLAAGVAAVPEPGEGEPREALERALDRVEELEDKWAGREGLIGRAAAD